MNSFINLYKQRFGEALGPLGFKRYRNTFYRVFSEVVQMLMVFERLCDYTIGLSHTSALVYTIEFNIKPLALGLDDLHCDGYEVSDFRRGLMGRCVWLFDNLTSTWHDYDANNGTRSQCKSMEDIAEEMLSAVVAHALPVFERGINAQAAYEELVSIEKAMHGDDYGPIVKDFALALLCVHAGDYGRARQHLELIVKGYDRAYAAKAAERERKQWNDVRERHFEEFMSEYQEKKELLRKVSIPDAEYLNEYVAKMTEKSLECIKKPRYPGLRRA